MPKFDLKDRKIMAEIASNSRFFVSDIAKKVQLNKDVVKYRLKVLEDKGIISRYQAMINVSKLGLMDFKVSVNLTNTSNEAYDEIVEYLKSLPNVISVMECYTIWDITFKVIVKDHLDFEEMYDDFKQKFSQYIERDLVETITEVIILPKNYLYEGKSDKRITLKLEKKEDFDKIDIQILKLLSDNARISLWELSQKIKLDSMTIKRRIDRMVKVGIIAGFQTFMVAQAANTLHLNVCIDLFDATQIKKMRNYILHLPNVVMMEKSIGGYDIRFSLEISGFQEYEKIIRDIRREFPVIKEIIQFFAFKYHRNNFFSEIDQFLGNT